MIECRLNLCSFLLNQHVKIDIDIPAHGLVLRVSVKLSLLLLFVLAASLSTRRLHLLDVVHDVARRRHIILFHLWLLSKAIGCLSSLLFDRLIGNNLDSELNGMFDAKFGLNEISVCSKRGEVTYLLLI